MEKFTRNGYSYEVSLIKTSNTSGVITRSNNDSFPKGTHIEYAWHMFAQIEAIRIIETNIEIPEGDEQYFDWF
jgi:hypothetical protein